MKVVILAGGSGARFWPASTSNTPKQFLKLFSNKTLIRQTFERFMKKISPENIIVVTSEEHVDITKKELPEIPSRNIFGEPFRKNTAPACFTGTLFAEENESILVVPADHRIPDSIQFMKYIDLAEKRIEENQNCIITFGIKPTRPETGYGYIEAAEEVFEKIYKVSRFHEKPHVEKAEEYLNAGNFFWNSGMFMWKKSFFMSEMKKFENDIYHQMIKMDILSKESIHNTYESLKSISIDYALMEKSQSIETVEAVFEWSDLGSWKSIMELESNSSKKSDEIIIDSENVFIRKTSDKPVAVIGLDNVIIIENENGILICSEDKTQEVREVTKSLEKTKDNK